MSEDYKDFFTGLLVGGLVGAALGILLAPKSGKETREELARKADELVAKAKEGYEKAAKKCNDAIEVEGYREGNSEETV